ncbi:nucleolar complex-associated protein-domain-containing protein [Mycotypha africana]|uniref:nucleolar complex-associated protein-domain-containing protein n=1 Tax=Mycotypha africana TaxID=64632 RepID=UPI0023009595|nr:nucleolar complex-associated protein-domain-containing protein [Mycotypha africana]KAI8979226.1 nucleolar complex-associated protein-domain-containing protein [Mycotypha africana]
MAAKKSAQRGVKAIRKNSQTDNNKSNNNTKKLSKKDKIPKYVDLPSDEEDDIIVSDEDLEFFAQNEEFADLLTNMDSNEFTKNLTLKDGEENKPKKKPSHESDEEMEYEVKPRKVANEWTKKDYHTKLPIKLPGGKIRQINEEELSERNRDQGIDSKAETDSHKEVVKTETTDLQKEAEEDEDEEEEEEEEPQLTKKEYIMKKKEELAAIALNIQGDPDENISQLKALRDIYRDDNPTIRKLSLLTQLAVYKDIIPGYRIRPLTQAEEETKVSKEVKKLRDYEKTLLSNYEAFLKDLNVLLSRKKTEEDASMSLVATRCLCELLIAKTHFNFRLEIMVAIVTRMSTVKWNEAAQLCAETLITVFENDESGRYSLDAVKMIIRMIKSKGFVISEKVIDTFLHLRLKDELAPVHGKSENEEKVGKKRKNNSKPFLTKKARKTLKETKEIEKEFQEAEAVVSKEEKDKNHTETLKLIFALYFRILKKQTSSPLLPAVLEGLSKFAHLISIDFFDDLLAALRDVMLTFEDSNDISRTSSGTRKRLLCIITAFQLMSGQGEVLNYDLKDFYTELYKILFKATYHTKIEEKPESQTENESDMIIKCLELMFLKKRQIPVNRMAAFMKRFALVALNMPSKTASQCLALSMRLMQKDHRLDALLQSEDRVATGVYSPLLDDPELCNPFGTSLYELFLYQNHYDPNVRNLAKSLQTANSS